MSNQLLIGLILREALHRGLLMKVVKDHLDSNGIKMIDLFAGKESFPFDFCLKSGFKEMEGKRMLSFDTLENEN